MIGKLTNKKLIFIIALILVLITFLTQYTGSNDAGEYLDTGKFFAGEYSAKIRGSHSYMFGFLHSPFIKLTESSIAYKLSSLIFLFLIIYSVYRINNRDKKTLWLMLLSPIVWFMAPWINPIQLSGLLLLWAYYFIDKFICTNKTINLIYSGILIGLGWAVWDTLLFFGMFLAVAYLYDKKAYYLFIFGFFIFVGLVPRLILDAILFNFPFASIFKSLGGILVNNLSSGIYMKTGRAPFDFANVISLILIVPLYYWKFYKSSNFLKNKKAIIFLTLCLLLILSNPQIRYLIAIIPIMVVLLGTNLNNKQFKIQLIFSAIVCVLVIAPYLAQINHSTENTYDITSTIHNLGNWQFTKISKQDRIFSDIDILIAEYPNEIFLVGNDRDEYAGLARLYWGDNVKEFVSIQDYNLAINNELSIFEKSLTFTPNIQDRRQIWFGGGLQKNENDLTDYDSIRYGIGVDAPLNQEGFIVLKKYDILFLSEKS